MVVNFKSASVILDWLAGCCSWIGPDKIDVLNPAGDKTLHLTIYTDTHSYKITATEQSKEKPNGYLGCIASCRKPLTGETWTRGNDLPDGPLSVKTFTAIMYAIVGYELLKIEKRPVGPPVPDTGYGIPSEVILNIGSNQADQ